MSSLQSVVSQQHQQKLETPQVQKQKPQQGDAIMVAHQPTLKQLTAATETSTTSTASATTAPEDVGSSTLTAQIGEPKQQQLKQDVQQHMLPLNQQKPSKHQFLHTMPINTKITATTITPNLQHAATISCNNSNNKGNNININIINGCPSSSSTSTISTTSSICRVVANAQTQQGQLHMESCL